MEFDPLEGVRIAAVFVDAAGGQLQASAGWVRRRDSLGLRKVQMAAQQQVAVLVDRRARFVAVEFGEVIPRVVEQRQAPVSFLAS